MVRGFYMLGSGMLTQSRVLSGISNNLANVNTTGYKKEEITTTTFGSMVMNRIGNPNQPLGSVSLMRIADKTNVIHSQGVFKDTGRVLDFAIQGEGFFAVQSENATTYTRNGSFNIDEQGYLTLDNNGRVLGQNGPIHIGTGQFTIDPEGNLLVNGRITDKIAVYDFADYETLKTAGKGLYISEEQPVLAQDSTIAWKKLEGSNVDAAKEMTHALAAERQLQACAQAIQMVDESVGRAATEIAKV